MKVIPTNCTKCNHVSCAVALDDQCIENPTWIEDNILNHICPTCVLAEAALDFPNPCLLHSIPIFYREYCPACALISVKAELGIVGFNNLMSMIEVGEV